MKKTVAKQKLKEREGEVFALLSAIGVTGYFVINRYVYTHYAPPSLDYTCTFMTIAGGIGLAALLVKKLIYKKRSEQIHDLPILLLIGVVAGIALGLTVIGQKYTLAANAGIISTVTVVTTAIYSRFILNRSLPRSKLPWVVLLLAGVYIAIVGTHTIHPHRGDWLLLASTLFFGFSNVLASVGMNKNSPGTVRDVRFIIAGTLFGFIILVFPRVSFVHGVGLYPYFAAASFWLGITFFNKAIKLIGPSHTIVINNSHPILTLLLSVPFLGELLTVTKLVGACLVILAIQKISSKKKLVTGRAE